MVSRAERRRRRRRQWYDQHDLEAVIRRDYPGCPDFAVLYFASYICTTPKNWRDASIEQAIDVTIRNALRHQHTDYDQMMLVGARRKGARRRVEPRIDAIIAGWKIAPAEQTPMSVEI